MRVAIFSEVITPYVSGVCSYIEFLRRGLESLGHEVLIVTASLHVKEAGFKKFHKVRGGIIRCPAKISDNKYGYECKDIHDAKTLDFICSFKPEVVHIHTDTKTGYLGLLVADKMNCPVVFTIHDYFMDRFADSTNMMWKIKSYFEKRHFRDMLDNADMVTSSCQRASRFIDEAGRKKQVVLIPAAVDLQNFDYNKSTEASIEKVRNRYHIPRDATAAVFAGDISVEKNLEFLLSAFVKYIKKSDNIKFLVVGDGTETLYLKNTSEKLRIADRVIFTGPVPHSLMPEIYSACDVYICSAEDALMSVSFMEAMGCGLPVLVKEDKEKYVYSMIKDKVNGFVYKDREEFAKYLKEIARLSLYKKLKLKQLVRGSLNHIDCVYMAKCTQRVYAHAIKIYQRKNK